MLQLADNPWLGLASYTTSDAHRFFGRQSEIRLIATSIRQNLCTIIYGKSGTGKTSLIHAGVMPELRHEQYVPVVIKLDHHAGHQPYDVQVIQAVTRAVMQQGGEVEEALTPAATALVPPLHRLWTFFHTCQFWSADNRRVTPVFFIDQFEEIFTLNEDPSEVSTFFSLIQELLQVVPSESLSDALHQGGERLPYHERPSFRLILSLREDFLPRFEDHAYFIPELCQNRIGIAALTGLQALDVMLCPAPGLIDRDVALQILSKICHRPVADQDAQLLMLRVDTCILSLFCSELYVKAVELRRPAVDASMVNDLGDDIIQSFYERSVKGISTSALEYLEDHLLTSSGYRNSLAVEDVVPLYASPKEVAQLEGNRIISRETVNGVERLQFTHDVLCAVAALHRHSRQDRSHRLRHSFARAQSIISILAASVILLTYRADARVLTFLAIITVGNLLQMASILRASRSIPSLGLQLGCIVASFYAASSAMGSPDGLFLMEVLSGIYSVLIFLSELATPSAPRIHLFVRSLDNAPFRLYLRSLLMVMLVAMAWGATVDGNPVSRRVMYFVMVPGLLSGVVWLFALCRRASVTDVWCRLLDVRTGDRPLQLCAASVLVLLIPLLCIQAYHKRFGTVALDLTSHTLYADVVCHDGRYGLRLGDKWVLPPVYAEIRPHTAELASTTDPLECLVDTKLLPTQPDYDVMSLSRFMAYHNAVTDSLAARMQRRCDKDQLYDYLTSTLQYFNDSLSNSRIEAMRAGFSFQYYQPLAIYYAHSDSLRADEYAQRSIYYSLLSEHFRTTGDDDPRQYVPRALLDSTNHSFVRQMFSSDAVDKFRMGEFPAGFNSGDISRFIHRPQTRALLAAHIPMVDSLFTQSVIPSLDVTSQTYYLNLLGRYHESQSIAERFILRACDDYDDETLRNIYFVAGNLFSSLLLQQQYDAAIDVLRQNARRSYVSRSDASYRYIREWCDAVASDLHEDAEFGLYDVCDPAMLADAYHELEAHGAMPGGVKVYYNDDYWDSYQVFGLYNNKLYWVTSDDQFVAGYPAFIDIKWTDYQHRVVCCESEQGYFLFPYGDDADSYPLTFYTTESEVRSIFKTDDDQLFLQLYPTCAIGSNPEFITWLNTAGRTLSTVAITDLQTPFSIPDAMIQEHPLLVKLVLDSKSMVEASEKQSWFDLYPLMNDEQIYHLYEILMREKKKLIEIEIKYSEPQG